ncbi:MAG TPA: hypothetical protein VFQ85_11470 [Mycobacteriales bacterium]|jgi:hypothetical protein|nr:hypothetical protein [Mycobacteriales bacterium]
MDAEGVVRYRQEWRQLAWYLAMPVPFLFLTRADREPVMLALFAVTWGCVATAMRAYGVEVRPDALVLLGLQRRVVLWSDVDAVYTESVLGTRVVRVVADGRVLLVRAPTHLALVAPDPAFDAKVATLVRYWEAHRGSAWTPPRRAQATVVARTTT